MERPKTIQYIVDQSLNIWEESEEDEWDEEESNKRMDVIGQNGNDGLHYDEENEE